MRRAGTFTVFAQLGGSGSSGVTILVMCCTAAVLVCAGDAAAVLTMGHVTTGALDGIVPLEGGYAAVGSSCNNVLFSLIADDDSLLQTNRFGIFDRDDPSRRLEIFAQGDHPSKGVNVKFDIAEHQAWIRPEDKVGIGPVFGFYLETGGAFYTDTMLDSGAGLGLFRSELFDTKSAGLPGIVPDILVCFEANRLDGLGLDSECRDFVVAVKRAACVVPEPAGIALLAAGGVALLRRNRRRAAKAA